MADRSFVLRVFAASCLCTASALPLSAARADAQVIQTTQATEILDIDGNGLFEALTDGILVLRYAFGLRGPLLIQGAIGSNATRTTVGEIEAYLASLTTTLPGNCSISAVPSSSAASPVAPGTQVQLTANCSTGINPITYQWSTGATGQSILVSPQSNTTYTVTPSNATGASAPFNRTVYAGFITAPSGCTIAQLPNTNGSPVAAGTSVALNLTCSGGNAPSSCSWNNGIVSTSCSVNFNAPATTTTYAASASNSGGTSAAVTSTVNVIVQSPGVTNYCTGPGDEIIGVEWPALGQSITKPAGFKNQRFAFKIIVATVFNPPLDNTRSGFWRVTESQGTAVILREVTVSKNPCDFESGNYLFNGMGAVGSSTSPFVSYTVNNPNGYIQAGAATNVMPGDTIYFNIRNQVNGSYQCPVEQPQCNILFDFRTP